MKLATGRQGERARTRAQPSRRAKGRALIGSLSLSNLLRMAFWSAAIFAFVMAVLPHPPQIPGTPSDKIQHILAFGILAGLAAAAYRDTPLIPLGIRLSIFGAVIELVQLIPALNRDADWADWVADTAAAAAILLLAAAVKRKR